MAIKESKRVDRNNKYDNFLKYIEKLTPTEPQENLAKEEIKKGLDKNKIASDSEVGAERVIKRRNRKTITPANVARLGSIRKRGKVFAAFCLIMCDM
jgi:hypothetical protein